MSNYTKTTDFEAKDSLPTGDSGKIIRGAEFETEFDAISTAIATKADTAGPTFTGTLTFETISDGTIGVTAFVDEDDMSSDSATLVPTQQSVKAYVDSQVTAQDLDFQADSGGALSIDLDSETLTFTGGTGIDTSGSGNAVTFAIDSTVATLTGTQTLTNKTLTSPDVNTPDIDGGTIDGTVIGGTTPAAVSATTVSATGNITVGGTVDGRDVATDGTKLDGIEAGATADQTAAEIRTLVESATDSNVFTDADHSKLDGIEAGADVTDTTNVTAAGAVMDSELTNETAVKSLDQGVATTDSPTFAGLTTTADVSFGDNDKAVFGAGSDLQIYHDGVHSYIADVGTGVLFLRGESNIVLENNSGSNYFEGTSNGASTIYYAGNAKLATTSTGIDVTGNVDASLDLLVGGAVAGNAGTRTINVGTAGSVAGGVQIWAGTTQTSFLQFGDDSSISANHYRGYLSYNHSTDTLALGAAGSTKVSVTSTGIDVTGTVTADGLTLADGGDRTITGPLNNDLIINSRGNTPGEGTRIQSSGSDRLVVDDTTGDISFYEDTGTTAKLFWDASAESLGIGTSSPSFDLDISTSSSNQLRTTSSTTTSNFYQTSSGGTTVLQNDSGQMAMYTGGSERFRIDSSGRLGIGTTSPSSYDGNADNLVIGGDSAVGLTLASSATNGRGSIYFADGTSGDQKYRGTVNYFHDSDALTITTAATERMRIDASGNVGIGTDSPTSFADTTLHVSGSTGSTIKLSSDAQGNANTDGFDVSHSGVTAFLNNRENGEMQFRTNNTEAMRIDSSGNLLVGTTSTTGRTDASSGEGIALSAGSYGGFIGATRSGANPLALNRLSSDGAVATFAKDGTTVGSIGSYSSNLLIGTGDTNLRFFDSSKIILPRTSTNGASNGVIDLGDSGNRFKDLYLSGSVSSGGTYRAGNTGTGNIILEGQQHIFRFGSGGSYAERARIDTSGNLLVGKTTSSFNTAGIEARSGGTLWATADGTNAASFNRKTSDGDIALFSKDGSTVGSIGVNSSRPYLVNNVDGGIHLSTDGYGRALLLPADQNGAPEDNLHHLGSSSYRWRDLYLAGGVYLGGTGSANHLDDYEEGTWTPFWQDGLGNTYTGSYASRTGRYTKVGRIVHATFEIYTGIVDLTANGLTGAQALAIGGFPFSSNSAEHTGGEVNNANGVNYSGDGLYLRMGRSVTIVYLSTLNAGTSGNDSQVTVTQANNGNRLIYGTITYEAA